MIPLAHILPRSLKQFVRRHSSLVGSVIGVRTTVPRIVLTYDDGPEPGGTDRVLDALAGHGVTATFFVLLTRARRYPGLLADVMAAGHEIALHGIDHRRLPDFSYREVQRRTADGKSELEDLSGRAIRWIRPPYGRQTLRTWRAVTTTGLNPVMWGPTMWDSRDVTQPERIAQALRGAEAGAIVLGHDGHAGPMDGVDDGPAPALDRRDLTDRVLTEYHARGLIGCSLETALTEGTLIRGAWFKR